MKEEEEEEEEETHKMKKKKQKNQVKYNELSACLAVSETRRKDYMVTYRWYHLPCVAFYRPKPFLAEYHT